MLHRQAGVCQGRPAQLRLKRCCGSIWIASRPEIEELRIEAVHLIEESAPARAHLAWGGRVVTEKGADLPTLGGHFADRVFALAEQPPEGVRVRGSRKSAGQADDGDRLMLGALHRDGARGGRCLSACQVRRHRCDGRVVPHQCGRERAGKGSAQLPGQLHCPHRIEPVVVETFVAVEATGVEAELDGQATEQPGLDRFDGRALDGRCVHSRVPVVGFGVNRLMLMAARAADGYWIA